MDRAYQSGAAGSAPGAPASPSIGYPTAGNTGSGTPATKPGPYWYHMVMEELMAIITAAGITPAQGNLTQLLTALRSAGVFQTPSQFDNTTKAATTAFVKSEKGGYSGHDVVGTSTLTASSAGKVVACAGAATITLPAASALPAGNAITFFATGAGVVIQRAGTDTIQPNGSTVTSITLNAGDTLVLESDGAGSWGAIGGSGQLGYSDKFFASKSTNGYQKLPSGLIIQWGAFAVSAGAGTALTYPVAFPTGTVALVAIDAGSGVYQYGVNNFGKTGCTIYCRNVGSFVTGT